jgi:hypothetical protein
LGDEKNTVTAFYRNGVVRLVELRDGKESEIARKTFTKAAKPVLRMQVRNGKDIRFFFSSTGRQFTALTMNGIDGSFLPPWDRAVRAGIVAKGADGTTGVFDNFEMVNQ